MDSQLIQAVDNNSRNVNVLLDLPSDLRTSVFAEWVEINDLARLDVAIIKGSLRQEYLTQPAHDSLQVLALIVNITAPKSSKSIDT